MNRLVFYRTVLMVIIFITGVVQAREVYVSSSSQFKNAIKNIQPGDTVWVNNGIYNELGSLTLKNIDGSINPVLISAVNIGEAKVSGESYFDLRQCSYVTIRGFLFTSIDVTAIKSQASSYIRISQNIFRLSETESLKWILIGGIWDNPSAESHHNRIDHNLFEEKHKPGNFITIDGSPDPVYKSSQYDRIDHNHFRNIGPRVENEMEAVRVGWSELSMSSGFTTLEYNLFENCDGDPEIISIKTCDDTVRFNTFRSCQGSVVLRHGNRSVVDANFFFGDQKNGTGGVRVYGNDHCVSNNYFQDLTGANWDAAITLTNGDYDGGGNLSSHFRINRALITHNTLINNQHNIEIGFTNNGSYTKPPRDVIINNNVVYGSANALVYIFTEPPNLSWKSNIMFADGTAIPGVEKDSSEIYLCDPLLVQEENIYRPSAQSPAINYISGSSGILTDIDFQTRDAFADAGCDEYSAKEIINRPLTAADVGPFALEIATHLAEKSNKNPGSFNLKAYPNPFNSELTIEFNIRENGYKKIQIFDMAGRQVHDLSSEFRPGKNRVHWNAGSNSSGIYVIHFEAESRKVLFLK